MRRLLLFFVPLGTSATLVTISHVIISSTLARSTNPEVIIASYAIAMSLLVVFEKPAILLRHTCSALVKDRISFRALCGVSMYLLGTILACGLIINYTPVGRWMFQQVFNAEPSMVDSIIDIYRIMMFVTLFSGIRSLYHGIIISNFRTKWLTIGMVIRLAVMALLSYYFLAKGPITNGQPGAIIFLSGMIIECIISALEGRFLLRRMPYQKPGHTIINKQQIFKFYQPLLYSSFIAVVIGPAINVALGKTSNLTLAIASFAIAASVTQLFISFFSYIHQIVLNFYRNDAKTVFRFVFIVSLIPGILLSIVAFSPIGTWFLQYIMGITGDLLFETQQVLKIFILFSVIFPWLDYVNGIVMLVGQTRFMVGSQTANVIIVMIVLLIGIAATPAWNGMIGALATSLGLCAELIVILLALRSSKKNV